MSESVRSYNSKSAKLGRIKPRDFFLTMSLVCVSGNMFFVAAGRDQIVLTIWALFLAWLLFRQSFTIQKSFLQISAGFLLVFVGQIITLLYFPLITILGFFIKLFVAFAIVRLVNNFPYAYVRVMRFVVILSFLFWIPDQILSLAGVDVRHFFRPMADFFNVESMGSNERINIGLYNYQTADNSMRNAAFFWEPGAFAGYLLLALMFLSHCRDSMRKKAVTRTLILFVIAILTTQSTMGIVVLPLVLLLFLDIRLTDLKNIAKSSFMMLIVGIFLIVFALSVSQLDFVGKKIVNLYERGMNQEAGWQMSRFGAMLFDWQYISRNPLTGWGQSNETQYQLHQDLERFATGNGMTGFVRQMGLLGMGIFLFMVWTGLRKNGLTKLKSAYWLMLLLLILNGEHFLLYPMFLSLMFLQQSKTVGAPEYDRLSFSHA